MPYSVWRGSNSSDEACSLQADPDFFVHDGICLPERLGDRFTRSAPGYPETGLEEITGDFPEADFAGLIQDHLGYA
jgi:hypothetical protein